MGEPETTRTSSQHPAADERKLAAGGKTQPAAENEAAPAGRSTTAPPAMEAPAADPATDEKKSAAGGDTQAAAENMAALAGRSTTAPATRGHRRTADPAAAKERDIPTPLTTEIPTSPTTAARRTSLRTTAGKLPEHLEAHDAPGTVAVDEGEIVSCEMRIFVPDPRTTYRKL